MNVDVKEIILRRAFELRMILLNQRLSKCNFVEPLKPACAKFSLRKKHISMNGSRGATLAFAFSSPIFHASVKFQTEKTIFICLIRVGVLNARICRTSL